MDGSIIFARWWQCVLPQLHINATWWIWLNLCIVQPTGVHNQNDKSIGSAVFAQLMTESAYTLQWMPLSTRIAPSSGGSGPLSNTIPRTHASPQPKRFSLFAQMTAECPYFTMVSRFPFKIAASHGGSGPPCNTWFLGPTQVNPITQTASRSLLPFLQGSLVWQTDRQTTLLGR